MDFFSIALSAIALFYTVWANRKKRFDDAIEASVDRFVQQKQADAQEAQSDSLADIAAIQGRSEILENAKFETLSEPKIEGRLSGSSRFVFVNSGGGKACKVLFELAENESQPDRSYPFHKDDEKPFALAPGGKNEVFCFLNSNDSYDTPFLIQVSWEDSNGKNYQAELTVG